MREALQRQRDDAGGNGRQRTEGNEVGARTGFGQALDALTEARERRLGVAEEDRAEIGQHQRPARPVEQRHVEDDLEFGDRLGHRGLGHAELGAGPSHATLAHRFKECAQVPKFDARIDGRGHSYSLQLCNLTTISFFWRRLQ